jgi:S-DNA-T family DNA segregation ATPase FtsK/SpoIIIE
MLEDLPHVGAVVSGDDSERVVRLLRTLRDLVEDRSRTFTAVNAGSIAEYRSLTGKPDEPRILVLVDNFPAFRDAYEAGGGRSQWYGVFLQLLTEGRQLGVHIVLTADRPAAVPGAVTASVPRRVVLRVADESMYLVLDVESDVLGPGSPPGRAIVDGSETQIAILGDSSSVADQSQAIGMLAETMRRKSIAEARPIDSLPTEVALESLPSRVGDKPLLGVSDVDLEPIGFDPTGTFLLGGGPASGRSNALAALALSVRRWEPSTEMIYLGHRRSSIPSLLEWDEAVTDQVEIASIAKELTNRVSADTSDRIAIVVESLSDLASAPTDTAIVELIRAIRRSSNLLIAESETSTWGSSDPIFGEIKAGRRGLLLQPEAIEGDTIMRTSFPRAARSEFPPGRGLYVQGGKVTRVQLPLV